MHHKTTVNEIAYTKTIPVAVILSPSHQWGTAGRANPVAILELKQLPAITPVTMVDLIAIVIDHRPLPKLEHVHQRSAKHAGAAFWG